MPNYTEEFREEIVKKMMPPNPSSLAALYEETGVSKPTLRAWRNKYREEGKAVPADPANPESWSGENKLSVVIETASLNEQRLSEYCRSKGLYVEQIGRWKEAAIAGNEDKERLTKGERGQWQQEKKKSRQLEKDLSRMESALAETAALLVLKKKAQLIWVGEEK